MRDKRRNYKKRKSVLGIGIFLILALGVGAYFFLLPGKTARQTFIDAESRNFKAYADWFKETNSKMKEERLPYLNENYKKRFEITADIKPGKGSAADTNEFALYDIIKKFKLVVDARFDPKAKTNMAQLSLLLEKTPFMDAQIYSNGQTMFFTVPVLTPDRYFKVDTGRLDEVYDRFNIPVRPKSFSGLLDPGGVIYFNGQELDAAAKEYGGLILKTITEKDVRYGENVEMTISGQKVKGREIVVEPGKEAGVALLQALAGQAGTDDRLLGLTYGNYAALVKVLDDAGILQLMDTLDRTGTAMLSETERGFLDAISAYGDLQGFKNTLTKALDGYTAVDGLKLKLVTDGQERILEQRLTMLLQNAAGNEQYDIEVHTGTNSLKYNDYRNRYTDVSIVRITEQQVRYRYYLRINPALEPIKDLEDSKGRLEISFGLEKDGVIQSGISIALELDASVDPLTSKKNNRVQYVLKMQSAGLSGEDSLTGEISTSSWKNNKLRTRNSATTLTAAIDMPSFNMAGYTAEINLTSEDRIGLEPFALPEIPAESTIDLNTASDEALREVEDEILRSFGTFYLTNKPIVDAVLGKK